MKTTDLTAGNVKKQLFSFALPFLAANLLQAFYGAADLFVVGQYNGRSAISAVNIGSQVMQIISAFVIGCTMGGTVVIGRHIGEKNQERCARALGSMCVIFTIFAVVITPIMYCLSKPISQLMQTPTEAFDEAVTYISICSLGIPFIILYNVTASLLRGIGDSKTPMMIVACACVVNITGDFLLAGYFGMGVKGVAIATAAAQLLSSIFGVAAAYKRGLPFKMSRSFMKINKTESLMIIKSGVPIAMQDTLINISFIIITVIANKRGLVSSSAVGVVEKLIMFMFLVPSSMLSAISAFTAQNFGAGKKERAVSAVKAGLASTLIFGTLMCAMSWIIPDTLTGIFSSDKQVINEAGEYLKTYSIDCILVAFTFCLNGYLCGCGKSVITFIHTTLSIFLVRIPAAYLLSRAFPNTMLPMGLASPLGTLLSIAILAGYFAWIKKTSKKNL